VYVLPGAHALLTLLSVHSGGRGENHRFEAGLFQAFGEIARPVRDFELLGHFFGGNLIPARQGDDLYARNSGHGLQMFHAESTLPSETDLHMISLTLNFESGVVENTRLDPQRQAGIPCSP
jgi:hypothetical protein